MIPYALLSCLIDEKEVRILDVSIFHIVIRIPEKVDSIIKCMVNVHLNGSYKEINIQHFSYHLLQENKYDVEYRIDIEDEEYLSTISVLMQNYNQYISYKQNDEQEKLTEYPMHLDSIYPSSYDELLKELFRFEVDSAYDVSSIHLGYSLDCFMDYEKFIELNIDSFRTYYFSKMHLKKHPIKQLDAEYIYIGNQFCSHLYPSLSMLKRIIEKCKKNHLEVVFMFSTMKQHEIEHIQEIINILKNYSIQEVVINDFGMMEMIKKDFNLIVGILLNKHVKDTRLKYHTSPAINQTSINMPFYQSFLKENGFTRVSYESCGYEMDMVKPVDLYFPKFQMNTSGYCTMYAKCHNLNRANQEEVVKCERYCESQYFLYPTHLHMVGKYNSLFGYDIKILKDKEYLDQYLKQVDRMIISV